MRLWLKNFGKTRGERVLEFGGSAGGVPQSRVPVCILHVPVPVYSLAQNHYYPSELLSHGDLLTGLPCMLLISGAIHTGYVARARSCACARIRKSFGSVPKSATPVIIRQSTRVVSFRLQSIPCHEHTAHATDEDKLSFLPFPSTLCICHIAWPRMCR